MPGPKHDIFIFKVAEGEYRVRPAVAVVEMSPQRPLKIRNMTGQTVIVAFPSTALPVGDDLVRPIPESGPGKNVLSVNLAIQAEPFRFQYSVSIHDNGVLVPAIGESAPSVIVDP